MSPAPSGRTRLLSFGLLAATFLVGALSGAAVDRVLGGEAVEAAPAPDRHESDRRGPETDGRRRYVIDEVEMSADQRASIDSILARRAERLRQRRSEERQQWEQFIGAITDSTLADIKAVLTPEQQAEYERRLEEMRQRFRDRADREGDHDKRDGGHDDEKDGGRR